MYLEKYGYGKAIDELERRGFWRKVASSEFTRYAKIGGGAEIGRFKPV